MILEVSYTTSASPEIRLSGFPVTLIDLIQGKNFLQQQEICMPGGLSSSVPLLGDGICLHCTDFDSNGMIMHEHQP